MHDVITIGNICVDLYYQSQNFTFNNNRFQLALGGKYYADHFYEDIGGGACNVASGLTHFNYKTAIFGKIGNNPFKTMILAKLKDKNIDSQFCQYQDNYYKISSILLTPSGERTIVNYESPVNLWQSFKLNQTIKSAKNVYISPLPHISLEEKNLLINHFKGDNITTVVNLSDLDCKRPLTELKTIFDGLDILMINSHEFANLVKKDYKDLDFSKNLSELLPDFQNKVLVVTHAEQGSYGYFNQQVIFQPAIIPKKIIDTTGAGDGYTAGFIAEYLKNHDTKNSMRQGAEYAAKILSKIGAN